MKISDFEQRFSQNFALHILKFSQNNISNAWAGGGGSYNNGSNTSNTSANNSGHGKVEISW